MGLFEELGEVDRVEVVSAQSDEKWLWHLKVTFPMGPPI